MTTRSPSLSSEPGLDAAILDLALGIDHVDILQPLVRPDGAIDDQQGRMRLPDRQPDPHEHAGQQQRRPAAGRQRIIEDSPRQNAARGGIDLVVDEVDDPLAGKALFALQFHEDGNLPAGCTA